MTILPPPRFTLNRARTHGAQRILSKRIASARAASAAADERGDTYFAAALRGKARGMSEALALLAALENDKPLPKRRREGDVVA